MDDNFTGIPGFGVTLQFTSDAIGAVAVPLQGILSVTPPPEETAAIKYTPISGDNSAREQVLPGKSVAQQATAKAVYEKTRHAALSALRGVRGTYLLTFADAAAITGKGFLAKIAVDEVNDTNEMTSTLTFELDGGFTYA